jgi:RNA polymerase sigma factor (sigma-70 family)
MLQNEKTEFARWDAVIRGDHEAYALLYKTYHPRLFNYGRKFVACAALIEDCIQEVLVRTWLHRHILAEVKNKNSYLFVSFRNSLMKAVQVHHKHAPGLTDDYTFSMEISVDQVMINQEHIYERRINLKQAVDRLSSRQKEAIFFKFYENMTYEEVAQILNISKKATYKLMARALTELKTIYKQQDVLLTFPSLLILHLLLLVAMA